MDSFMNEDGEEISMDFNMEASGHALEKTQEPRRLLCMALAHMVALAPDDKKQQAAEAGAELILVCLSHMCHFHYMAWTITEAEEKIKKISDSETQGLIADLLMSGAFKEKIRRAGHVEKEIARTLVSMAPKVLEAYKGQGPSPGTGSRFN